MTKEEEDNMMLWFVNFESLNYRFNVYSPNAPQVIALKLMLS